MKKYKNTYELCPHCGEEVKLDAELKVQTCPRCGRRIVACSMCYACDTDKPYCSLCCLSYQADIENKEMGLLDDDDDYPGDYVPDKMPDELWLEAQSNEAETIYFNS